MTEPQRMIPCTKSLMDRMLGRVMEVMQERGLIEVGENDEATADQVMHVLEAHGMVTDDRNIPLGRCVLLPRRESGPDPGFSLLLVTPCPADEYDADLRRKPSPVQFERTERGDIVLPSRWLITKLEELADNPAAPAALQPSALDLARRGHVRDMVLPPEMETVALTVAEADGTSRVIEALPGGVVISLDFSE